MTQRELDRHVAGITGEAVAEIRRRGFSIANLDEPHFDPEPDDFSRYVDWDTLDAERYSLLPC